MPIVSGSGSGSGVVSAVSVNGSGGGDITTTSSPFVDITGITTSISAAAGDKLLVAFFAELTASATATITVRTITTTGSHNTGGYTYQISGAGALQVPIQEVSLYTVVSGDISAGLVAIKAQWSTSAGTATAKNSAGVVPTLVITNLLH